jgi:hypothetical protein
MVRRAKRSLIGKRASGKIARDGMDEGNSQQFARIEFGQDRGQPRGEHRLARARRSVEQKIVASRGGDFERPFGAFLSREVAKIGLRRSLRLNSRVRPCHDLRALKMIGELN